ncbi:MAG: AAA family ATPase, partial [Planctomyces sp.]
MSTSSDETTAGQIKRLRASIASVFLGSEQSIDQLICCLLARGHCLIEDVPGVGKTILATSLARSIDAGFARLQLTPDLLPSDILGVSIYRRETDRFEFKPGPIFANIGRADEINRATPRTQTALLEAMSDSAVTIDGKTHPLPEPFMVVATQNPTDFHGTFALPENQLDRFLMRVTLGYPSPENEARVLQQRPAQTSLRAMSPVLSTAAVLELQKRVDSVAMDKSLVEYIIALATRTRQHAELQLGLSPRGALALSAAARASAVLAGRGFVVPEDIVEN